MRICTGGPRASRGSQGKMPLLPPPLSDLSLGTAWPSCQPCLCRLQSLWLWRGRDFPLGGVGTSLCPLGCPSRAWPRFSTAISNFALGSQVRSSLDTPWKPSGLHGASQIWVAFGKRRLPGEGSHATESGRQSAKQRARPRAGGPREGSRATGGRPALCWQALSKALHRRIRVSCLICGATAGQGWLGRPGDERVESERPREPR